MKLRTIKNLKNLKGKKVLLRTDFNVPIKGSKILDDYKIIKGLETIKYLTKKGAIVIIIFHLGQPHGKFNKNLKTDPIAKYLSRLLKKKILKLNNSIGPEVKKVIDNLKPGEIVMLENIRFQPREEMNCKKLAKELASLANIYINDALASSHRNHSSVSAITEFLPSYAGLLLEKEVKILNQVIKNSKKPLIVIIGGAKISTKIDVIKNLINFSDKILLGGALANTVLKAMGIAVGKSIIEPKMVSVVKKIKLTNNTVQLPVDVLVAKNFKSEKFHQVAVANVKTGEYILDIGPDTLKLFENIIKKAKMVVWNGPMGLIENPVFSKSTKTLAKILAESRAKTIIGGGETIEIIRKLKLENKFYFISTAGGAMLEFLEGKILPGIKPLIK